MKGQGLPDHSHSAQAAQVQLHGQRQPVRGYPMIKVQQHVKPEKQYLYLRHLHLQHPYLPPEAQMMPRPSRPAQPQKTACTAVRHIQEPRQLLHCFHVSVP